MTVGGLLAGTAPVPYLDASKTYVNPNDPVVLDGGATFAQSTCAFAKAHLVGIQEYDGKPVLDETWDPNLFHQFSKTVQPPQTVTYSLTMECTLAFYAEVRTVTKRVQVYPNGPSYCGGSPAVTAPFCMQCPAGIDGFPPQPVTYIETACSAADAKKAVQSMGTNCTVSDGACH